MDFSIKSISDKTLYKIAAKGKAECWVLAMHESARLSPFMKAMDESLDGMISRLMKAGEFTGKAGETLFFAHAHKNGIQKVLLLGAGKSLTVKQYQDLLSSVIKTLKGLKLDQITLALHELKVAQRTELEAMRDAVIALRSASYAQTHFKTDSEAENKKQLKIENVQLTVEQTDQAQASLLFALSVAHGAALTAELGDLPSNICTPSYLAERVKKLAQEWKMKAEVLGLKQIQALKMNAFYSVAKGSNEPPQLIVLHYQGAAAQQAPIVLVGKGITFDSGGISLKPGAGMDEMKYDMLGAGAVIGTMRAITEQALALNVIAVIPTCENMPSGHATKPGDIVTTMSGKTVEVLNTDAEGRLILSDALTYVERFKPAAVIDVATLTGACIVALGRYHSGLYANDQSLADELLQASRKIGDPAWQMPLDDAYQEQLNSPFADMANIGGSAAGSITAACFLARFTKAYPWAHLDVAGTAWRTGPGKGATGRPVPLLAQFLLDRAQKTPAAQANVKKAPKKAVSRKK